MSPASLVSAMNTLFCAVKFSNSTYSIKVNLTTKEAPNCLDKDKFISIVTGIILWCESRSQRRGKAFKLGSVLFD